MAGRRMEGALSPSIRVEIARWRDQPHMPRRL
jgi:hypothetical protein